ncbi:MAG TPA: TIR domain-containing protein [Thermoanaerobaculia bacterium]|nr:TIR domain-containing protein [Thermoanaerobaculia bacterium]
MAPINRDYDVVLSFAGEDRSVVEGVATALKLRHVRVFYDSWEKAELWGADLYQRLDDIYQNKASYCLIFVSANYVRKAWANHELRSAQARALREHVAYILPVRLDDTAVPGIPSTIGHVDLRRETTDELCDLIGIKLGHALRRDIERIVGTVNHLGYELDRLSGLHQGTNVTAAEREEWRQTYEAHSLALRKYFEYLSEWRQRFDGFPASFELRSPGIPGNNG